MMSSRQHCKNPEDTIRLAHGIAPLLSVGDTVCLCGELGAGKSVIARAIAGKLGVHTPMPSPTFVIAIPYVGTVPLLHIDLYRLHTEEEWIMLDMDTEMSRSVSLIEWADRFPSILHNARFTIHIQVIDGTSRAIQVIKHAHPGN